MKKIVSALVVITTIVLMTISCSSSRHTVSSNTYYSGDGIPQKTEWRQCAVCNGRGTCSACKGTGKISGSTCKKCKGDGRCRTCRGQGGYEIDD